MKSKQGLFHGLLILLDPVRPVFGRHRARLTAGLAALILVDGLQLIIPRILKHAIDRLTGSGATTDLLLHTGALIILLAALVLLFRFLWRVLVIGFSRLVEQHLRERLFTHLLTLDRGFFRHHATGDLMAHASNDLSSVQLAFGMGMVATLDALIMSVAAFGFMLTIEPSLTLVALAPMPFLALTTRLLTKRLHHAFSRVQKQFGTLTEVARTALRAISLVQGYGLQDSQVQRMDRLGRSYARANIRVAAIQGTLHPVAVLSGNIGMALVVWVGGQGVVRDQISLGDLVAFIAYLNMLIWPMMAIGWVANLFQRGRTSLERINTLLAARSQTAGGTVQLPEPGRRPPRITMHGLRFAYPHEVHPVLDGIDLELDQGVIGLAGRSGSGKTTLCRLLTGQYRTDPAMIRVNGCDLNSIDLPTYWRWIAYVGQEPVLFSGTIGDNISLGCNCPSELTIEDAARLAGIHDEIISFSDAYQTVVGERGIRLSGGQKQRLCLARALFMDRPVLIIDDGLSGLDVDTENRVLERIIRLYSQRLLLLVSHRISVLNRCDRIVMLEQGRVLAVGGPNIMIAKSELYRTMLARQGRHA